LRACAWREVIAEETGAAADHNAAKRACEGLSASDRAIVNRAEDDLRARLHLPGAKTRRG
jgi:hypothetical protein